MHNPLTSPKPDPAAFYTVIGAHTTKVDGQAVAAVRGMRRRGDDPLVRAAFRDGHADKWCDEDPCWHNEGMVTDEQSLIYAKPIASPRG